MKTTLSTREIMAMLIASPKHEIRLKAKDDRERDNLRANICAYIHHHPEVRAKITVRGHEITLRQFPLRNIDAIREMNEYDLAALLVLVESDGLCHTPMGREFKDFDIAVEDTANWLLAVSREWK